MKLVQISDTHISRLGGTTNENLAKIVGLLNEQLRPDAVVHSGDVSILDPDEGGDREAARALLAGIQAPLRVLPGNHDVGEPGDGPWAGIGVTSERLAAFRSVFGEDRWVDALGEWALIGFNSEIIGSGLPEEQEQWDWLESLGGRLDGRPAIVFCHKPIWSPTAAVSSAGLSVAPEAVARLESTFAGIEVQAFASGHLHRFALGERRGAHTVSAPSTAFVHRGHEDLLGPGVSELGVVEYLLEDGAATPAFRRVAWLEDAEPMTIPAFAASAQALGVTI